jgi:DMSO/TMAO reductase YedYZ molybdopterin-dependent catalytic subunit
LKRVRPPQVRPYLTTRSLSPENQETPINFLYGGMVNGKLFYRRNHFPYPDFVSSFFWLPITGFIQSSKVFSFKELLALPSKTIKMVLECSGDKRSLFHPKVFGEQWEKGAISEGTWKGISLTTLFKQTGLMENAKEVVFEGYDSGSRTDSDKIYNYARSLPLEKALHPDTILAYEFNGKPIPFKHGYPLRLIVPNWYAMASVKWIKKITVIDKFFTGPFQADDYVYYPSNNNDNGKFPVTTINVNSTIQRPLDMQILKAGIHKIEGVAWTGTGKVTRVDISLDGGSTWNICQTSSSEKYVRTYWNYEWIVNEKGNYTIMSKATDSSGNVQPLNPFWNRKGYGYNAIEKIEVKVE